MVDPKMTKFKATSMDEHMLTIENLAQEALGSKEEIRAIEATEVQSKGLSLTLEA
jgi:hypothetical protein